MSDQGYAQFQQKMVSESSPAGSLLQRSCACGRHTIAGGECDTCRNQRLTLQRSQNASKSAAVPVALPGSSPAQEHGHGQSRHIQTGGMGRHAAPPIVHEALRSPGQPLDAATRAFMESRFGYDFSQVRVHSSAAAEQSARAVNALAYTVGRDIVFRADRYAPKTSAGQRLLAHELTHVVQQRHVAPGLAHSASLQLDSGEDTCEREAKSVADRLTSSERLPVSRMEQREGRISRQPEEEGLQHHPPAESSSGGLLPYREAMEELDRKLHEEYVRNCAGIRILERLERKAISPSERIRGLERRIQVIPVLFQAKRHIEQERDPAGSQKKLSEFYENQVTGEFPRFPEGYALGSEEAELATARCELSKAQWELVRPPKVGFGRKD